MKQLNLKGDALKFDLVHTRDYKGKDLYSEKATIEKLEENGYTVITTGLPDLLLLTKIGIRWIEVKSNFDMPIRQSQLKTFRILKEHGMEIDIYFYEEKVVIPFNCDLDIQNEQTTTRKFLKWNHPKRGVPNKLLEILTNNNEVTKI